MSKINVSFFLHSLNDRVADYNSSCSLSKKLSIEPLNCKTLAKKVGVTAATISNLNTDSKFSLLYEIADTIFFHYQLYFMQFREESLINYRSDSDISPYDIVLYDRGWVLELLGTVYVED